MTKSITIRGVPEEVCNELASRAALSRQSLQEYLLGQLSELAYRPEPAVLTARVRERKARTGSYLSTDRILALRDTDRK